MAVPSCQIKIGKYDALNVRAFFKNAKGWPIEPAFQKPSHQSELIMKCDVTGQ
jgi:hypothetical protein